MTRNWIVPAAVSLCVMAGATIGAKPRALEGVATPRLAVAHQDRAAVQSGAKAQGGPAEARALLDNYCVTCHNQRVRIPAGLPLYLDKADVTNLGADLEVWEKVVRRLRSIADRQVGVVRCPNVPIAPGGTGAQACTSIW